MVSTAFAAYWAKTSLRRDRGGASGRCPSVSKPVIADRVCEPLTRGVAASEFMVRLITSKRKYGFRKVFQRTNGVGSARPNRVDGGTNELINHGRERTHKRVRDMAFVAVDQ